MKAVAYSTRQFEKELLEEVDQQKHELKFLSAELCVATADYASGYDAVIVFINDDVSAEIIERLSELGVKYILTRSVGTDHIDMLAANKHSIKVFNVPAYSPQAVAEHAVALAMALARKLVPTYDDCRNFNFKIDDHMGFNFYKKTVGLIGLGSIGQASAAIFKGLGCRILGYDVVVKDLQGIEQVSLDSVLENSDIISLHVPFNAKTHYLIDKDAISKMKKGVMLINTSRGGVVNTRDGLDALVKQKIGYLGLDVYEYEKGLFFEDHQFSVKKDLLLTKLMDFPNVIITPHQGFLTKEAVTEIATSIIKLLDETEHKDVVLANS